MDSIIPWKIGRTWYFFFFSHGTKMMREERIIQKFGAWIPEVVTISLKSEEKVR